MRQTNGPVPPWLTIVVVAAFCSSAGYSSFNGGRADYPERCRFDRLVELVPGKSDVIRLTRVDAAELLGLTIVEVRSKSTLESGREPVATRLQPQRRIAGRVPMVLAAALVSPKDDSIAIPATALVEDGISTTVFATRDAGIQEFHRVPVTVLHRDVGMVQIDRRLPLMDGAEPIHFGDRIIASGVVGLVGEMTNLRLNRPVKD